MIYTEKETTMRKQKKIGIKIPDPRWMEYYTKEGKFDIFSLPTDFPIEDLMLYIKSTNIEFTNAQKVCIKSFQ